MTSFSLDDGWTVEYAGAGGSQDVPHLPVWACPPHVAEARLKRRFDLEAADFCVHYAVEIERAPPVMQVYVNDEPVTGGSVARVDITDYVSLGENWLTLRVSGANKDNIGFGAVRLLQIPCDETH